MFQLFKSISSKVYLVAVIILITATVFFYKAYTNSLVEKGALQAANGTLQQNVEHVEKSASITDNVIADYVEASKKSQSETDKLRRETIDEYVKKIPAVVPAERPRVESAIPDGADRVGILADRLHENYCRARPEDARCSTKDTSK